MPQRWLHISQASLQAFRKEVNVNRDSVLFMIPFFQLLRQLMRQQKKELLSALAFYISKRVEINFSKLRMNRVSITLYDVVKSTGEVKDVFRFTYEGRDYICLSHSERIRAGLEVAELIKRLLGVEYPTFIDDVESVPVIDNVRPTGQVFIAKVIKGTALQVQVADNTGVPKAA